jgi:ubiquinone/menaquinone biosynthesis C-methylase UbiE
VYAVDQKQDALDALAQRAADEGLSNLRCINTGGAVEVPLDDASVDVILLYDVIHLMGWVEDDAPGGPRKSTAADRRRLLEEARRVARPGALLSAYIQHVHTHTDAKSEAAICREIERCGFELKEAVDHELVHDDQMVRGEVLNFRCAGDG